MNENEKIMEKDVEVVECDIDIAETETERDKIKKIGKAAFNVGRNIFAAIGAVGTIVFVAAKVLDNGESDDTVECLDYDDNDVIDIDLTVSSMDETEE